MPFAQLVVGPPGSGKSTYCDGMQQFLNAVQRPTSVVNLDPANDHTSYIPALDVRDLDTLENIQETEDLGPNGGILYALEQLEESFEWLQEGLETLKDDYILFDCPGQVELFTHHESLRNVFFRLQKLGLYIHAVLLSLRSMLQLDLPHVNVLTKIDNLNQYTPLSLPLKFYTDAAPMDYLLSHLDQELSGRPLRRGRYGTKRKRSKTRDPPATTQKRAEVDEEDPRHKSRNDVITHSDDDISEPEYDVPMDIADEIAAFADHVAQRPPSPETPEDQSAGEQTGESKYHALNAAIIDLLSTYGQVGYIPLSITHRRSVATLVHVIDRASGYIFSGDRESAAGANDSVWSVATSELKGEGMSVEEVEERFGSTRGQEEGERKEAEEREWWEGEARRMGLTVGERGSEGPVGVRTEAGGSQIGLDDGTGNEDGYERPRRAGRWVDGGGTAVMRSEDI